MSRQCLLLSLLVFLLLPIAPSGANFAERGYVSTSLGYSTGVGGAISVNTTWTMGGSPYIVTSGVIVLVDVFLTIEPGVVVKFANGTSLLIDGTLITQGNSINPVTFTSNAANPHLGDWGSITVRAGGSFYSLRWLSIEYSSNGIEGTSNTQIIHSTFLENGVGISGSGLEVEDCNFTRNNLGLSDTSANITSCWFYGNANGMSAGNASIVGDSFAENDQGAGVSNSNVTYSVFYNNTNGLTVSCGYVDNYQLTSAVAECSFDSNKGTGIYVRSPEELPIEIRDSNVTNNWGDGIGGSEVTREFSIHGCLIQNNGGWGVSVPVNDISDSMVSQNSVGVYLAGTLSNSNVSGNAGPGIIGYGSLTNSTINKNHVGVQLELSNYIGGWLDVSNCVILDNVEYGITTGPYVEGMNLFGELSSVSDTIIENNDRVGINMNSSGVIFDVGSIVNSVIANNSIGIVGKLGAMQNSTLVNNSQLGMDCWRAGSIHYSNIYNNGAYNIVNHVLYGSNTNATDNWWGSTDKTLIQNKIYDYYDNYSLSRVIYQPYLAGPVSVQRRLTVTSTHDSPNPTIGDHFYNIFSSVTCNVTSPVTENGTIWTCAGWTGTGSVPPSGTGSSVAFTLTSDSSITWNWRAHDVAVTDVKPYKTVVGLGSSTNLNVTVANKGTYSEVFNVTAYANMTVIGERQVTLARGNSTVISFTWNTVSYPYSHYNLTAYASRVVGETNTANNRFVFGIVTVAILGDVNGDKRVNVLDLISIAIHLGHSASEYSPYSPDWYKYMNTDLNNDGKINVLDLINCALHMGQHW